ncbi:hypothetical protein WMB10_11055, partial [Tetragenococcus halophilus]|uniref:hypothetical protein n=1 Tax=Tetragenococcus halophilus TaxID=51669 RepID=UPI0030C8EC03
KRENNIKVTSLSGRMRYPQIFINHSGIKIKYKNFPEKVITISQRTLKTEEKTFNPFLLYKASGNNLLNNGTCLSE